MHWLGSIGSGAQCPNNKLPQVGLDTLNDWRLLGLDIEKEEANQEVVHTRKVAQVYLLCECFSPGNSINVFVGYLMADPRTS